MRILQFNPPVIDVCGLAPYLYGVFFWRRDVLMLGGQGWQRAVFLSKALKHR